MKIKQISLKVLLSVIVLLNACSKDEDNDKELVNPYNDKTTAVFNTNVVYDSITDLDGNIYKTVVIGKQTWMAENLRTTKYNDGTPIPIIENNDEWSNLTTPAYCNYNNTQNIDTIATFGRLYNWYAVNTEKLAPKGWHIPSHDEWNELQQYLEGDLLNNVGTKLKEIGTTHWLTTSTDVTNETGFTGLPGGYRDYKGYYGWVGYLGYWWNSWEKSTSERSSYTLICKMDELISVDQYVNCGISVRCIKD